MKRRRKRAGVVIDEPGGPVLEGGEEEEEETSEDEARASEEDSDGNDGVPDWACRYIDSQDDECYHEHEDRKVLWGIWSFSEIWAAERKGGEKKHVGYGGNCGCHFDRADPHRRCKRSLRFLTNSKDECRCLVKQWLLMGLRIRSGDPTARTQHLTLIPRSSIPLRAESDLDREADELQ